MQRVFVGILRRAVSMPDTSIRQSWAHDEDSRDVQARLGKGNTVPTPTGNVFTHFCRVAEEHEQRVAVSTPDEVVTYGELRRRVEAIRVHLAANGVGAGDRLGVALAPSADFPATLLALMAMGAVYVPIYAMNPPGRIATIIENAAVQRVICDATTAGVAPALEFRLPADLSDATDDAEAVPGGDTVAYLMYTLGSTGTPKGVLISHDSILGFIQNIRTLFERTPQDRFLGYASCGFDVSVFEVFGALLTGASLHLVPSAMRLDMVGVQRFLEDRRITVTDPPPSVMKLLDPAPLGDGQWSTELEFVMSVSR
ncbi:AMP-binding protein [Streptomyces sp. CNQ085]|uniref:AMP-binding protein n=1 Tax=Streptomyces sp. CNQ085 TaxID=2886944 RepID=UPI001F5042FE|nr:AMP-binding protein [Streptomyces sp. CNQ085]MCI0386743.1 AMP-binding protein [Streptomyces sp. CNQ085]